MKFLCSVIAFSIVLPCASCITCLQGLQTIGFSNLTSSSCLTGQICNRVHATVTLAGNTSGKKPISDLYNRNESL